MVSDLNKTEHAKKCRHLHRRKSMPRIACGNLLKREQQAQEPTFRNYWKQSLIAKLFEYKICRG